MIFLANLARKDRFFKILGRQECFLDKKKEVSEMSKQLKFSKRLVHSFCQKIELFIIFVFWANQPRKNRFFKFWTKKNAFYTRKRKFFKSPSIGNFSKGLVHGFRKRNRTFYHVCFFGKLSKKRSFFDVLN